MNPEEPTLSFSPPPASHVFEGFTQLTAEDSVPAHQSQGTSPATTLLPPLDADKPTASGSQGPTASGTHLMELNPLPAFIAQQSSIPGGTTDGLPASITPGAPCRRPIPRPTSSWTAIPDDVVCLATPEGNLAAHLSPYLHPDQPFGNLKDVQVRQVAPGKFQWASIGAASALVEQASQPPHLRFYDALVEAFNCAGWPNKMCVKQTSKATGAEPHSMYMQTSRVPPLLPIDELLAKVQSTWSTVVQPSQNSPPPLAPKAGFREVECCSPKLEEFNKFLLSGFLSFTDTAVDLQLKKPPLADFKAEFLARKKLADTWGTTYVLSALEDLIQTWKATPPTTSALQQVSNILQTLVSLNTPQLLQDTREALQRRADLRKAALSTMTTSARPNFQQALLRSSPTSIDLFDESRLKEVLSAACQSPMVHLTLHPPSSSASRGPIAVSQAPPDKRPSTSGRTTAPAKSKFFTKETGKKFRPKRQARQGPSSAPTAKSRPNGPRDKSSNRGRGGYRK